MRGDVNGLEEGEEGDYVIIFLFGKLQTPKCCKQLLTGLISPCKMANYLFCFHVCVSLCVCVCFICVYLYSSGGLPVPMHVNMNPRDPGCVSFP